MLSPKEKSCLRVSKKIRLKALLKELSEIWSMPYEFAIEMRDSFKWGEDLKTKLFQFSMLPIGIILMILLLLAHILSHIAVCTYRAWKVIREPVNKIPEEHTIEGLWLLNGQDSYEHFSNGTCTTILYKWLDVLYNGMVDIDLSERINTVRKNRKEFAREQQAHIFWGDPPIDTVVRNIANELPWYGINESRNKKAI